MQLEGLRGAVNHLMGPGKSPGMGPRGEALESSGVLCISKTQFGLKTKSIFNYNKIRL